MWSLSSQVDRIFQIFNANPLNIKFTFENESERAINFLDVTIIRKQNQKPSFNWYRKPARSGRHFIAKYHEEAILEMLVPGIIKKTDSPYCNPLRIVVRSNNLVRVCLDARYINEIIELNLESSPLISKLLQRFHGVRFILTADLTYGYW